ncbi:MAG: SDR family oxidoreductase, partial [Acidisphaera sp.]|nr:SDR family oxidoreductase [Acidisphaera sp.]
MSGSGGTQRAASDRFRLDGAHALVTGASGGLGRHFASCLSGAGARVTLAARREAHLAQSVALIEANGGEAAAVTMDVRDAARVEQALDRAEATFGPVRVLINNAGIAETAPALEASEEDWDRVVGTNLTGAWITAQATARRMVRHQVGGSIVNIASILGLRVAGRVAAYAASKAGLIQM